MKQVDIKTSLGFTPEKLKEYNKILKTAVLHGIMPANTIAWNYAVELICILSKAGLYRQLVKQKVKEAIKGYEQIDRSMRLSTPPVIRDICASIIDDMADAVEEKIESVRVSVFNELEDSQIKNAETLSYIVTARLLSEIAIAIYDNATLKMIPSQLGAYSIFIDLRGACGYNALYVVEETLMPNKAVYEVSKRTAKHIERLQSAMVNTRTHNKIFKQGINEYKEQLKDTEQGREFLNQAGVKYKKQ